ncbi:MAG: hypothetical protein QM656_12765 [Paracoccaceae bacterium]
MATQAEVDRLIGAWIHYRLKDKEPERYDRLRQDLYAARNGEGWRYPAELISSDTETMAAVEHYFLCRAWVGTGKYSAAQMRAMNAAYGAGKEKGLIPRHNPDKPVSPPSQLQRDYEEKGVVEGERDASLAASRGKGKDAPTIAMPPLYYMPR